MERDRCGSSAVDQVRKFTSLQYRKNENSLVAVGLEF